MKKRLVLLISSLIFGAILWAENTAQNYLEGFTRGDFKPKTLKEICHLSDGERYATLSDDCRRIEAGDYATGTKIEVIFDVEKAKNCSFRKIDDYEFSANEQRILIRTNSEKIYRRSQISNYWVYDVRRGTVEPLSEIDNRIQAAQFSPNGRIVAFARGNNLFLKKLDFGTELAITTDGEKNVVINGTADWIYEEEFCRTRCFEWSSDSKLLAYLRFDERDVKQFSFQNFATDRPTLTEFKYTRAGEQNSVVSLRVYDVANRTTKTMQTGDETDIYLPIIRWTNEPNTLAAVRLNRSQNQLDLLAFNARSGVPQKLFSEASKTYVNYENFDCLHFNSDGSFVTMSDRNGYRNLYLFDANGTQTKQFDAGSPTAEVTDFYGYDEATQTAYFQTAVTPQTRFVAKSDKRGTTFFDTTEGTHSAQFSANFKYRISQFNNIETPNRYTLFNSKGKKLRLLEDNAELAEKISGMRLPKKEFFTFTTSENIELKGWIVKPNDLKISDKYPLVMVQYSGPLSQEVLNKWHMDWEYHLAQLGFVVACVDGRGTGCRGREFATCTYGKLGELETKDQIEAAKYLGNLPFVDKKNITIWGWSYGGFMTLNCLTHGRGTFAAGIAIAPVTDWHYYNSAYTERFMNRPQENDRGYSFANLIEKADNLQGRLLLIHGTSDDNVHTQQTWLYIEKLVEAGKQFEMQMYPNKNHSILGDKTRLHLYTRCAEFLRKK